MIGRLWCLWIFLHLQTCGVFKLNGYCTINCKPCGEGEPLKRGNSEWRTVRCKFERIKPHYLLHRKKCRKVMFSVMCACHSGCQQGREDHHVTITHDASVHAPLQLCPFPPDISDLGSPCHGRWPPITNIWWPVQ